MRPGLPDPLLDLLGARWSMGAPVTGCAWLGDAAAFGLADGTIAIARARWDGAAGLQAREGGGVELVPASASPPPVMRVGVHAGPCLAIAGDGAGGALSGGADGRFARMGADGQAETLAAFPGESVGCVAAGVAGSWACSAGSRAHRSGVTAWGAPDLVTALAFSPDGGELAVGHRDGVTLWAADGGTRTLARSGTHRSLAWTPDGGILASGLEENGVHGWRVAGGADIDMGGSAGPVLSLAYSAAGVLAGSGGARVACWRFDGGGAARSECGVGSTVPVSRVACHPRRALIAAGYANGAVLLCQPDGTDILFARAAGGGAVSALAWSADGAFLALAAEGGEIGVVAFPERLFRTGPAEPEEAAR